VSFATSPFKEITPERSEREVFDDTSVGRSFLEKQSAPAAKIPQITELPQGYAFSILTERQVENDPRTTVSTNRDA
jgi:hypothetical protein